MELERNDEQAKEYLKKTFAKPTEATLDKEVQKPMEDIIKGVVERNKAAKKRKYNQAVKELKRDSKASLNFLDEVKE